MRYRIGILGATGYIGTAYRQEIREAAHDAQIVALCARRQDRLALAASEDGAMLATDDWRKVVQHPDVNLVLVLTPDALHYEPVLACAALGKPVLCEKPVGKDVVQAAAMRQAVQAAGVASFVPYWTRYVPVFRRAKQLVEAGKLGDVRAVVYRWHNPRPLSMPFTWRDDAALSSAGSIADVGSHAYDTLRFILGEEAKRVLTHAQVLMPPKPNVGKLDLAEAIEWRADNGVEKNAQQKKGSVPDYAQISLEFERGAVGSIVLSHASYLRKGFAPELELHGTRASLGVDRIRGELSFADSTEPASPLESTDDGYCNRFEEYVFPALDQQIGGAVSEHPNLDDGWHVQMFTDAALASSQRSTWVSLSQ